MKCTRGESRYKPPFLLLKYMLDVRKKKKMQMREKQFYKTDIDEDEFIFVTFFEWCGVDIR